MEIQEIPIRDIRVSNANVRKDLQAGNEDTGLRDLANSIRENGLLSPIAVKPLTGGIYDLVIGQRRFLACRAGCRVCSRHCSGLLLTLPDICLSPPAPAAPAPPPFYPN